ncbi:hypothetical protein J6590_096553 [Homalodisca vitripennis]|nr:hypothetical protein J6590_096553 [Homalodisca vitripennis]
MSFYSHRKGRLEYCIHLSTEQVDAALLHTSLLTIEKEDWSTVSISAQNVITVCICSAGVPTQQMSEISRRCTTTHVTAELALALTQLSERL